MNEYFEREILHLERELTNLKTAAQKSSAIMKTTSQTVTVTVQLQYEDISYPTGSARAQAAYEIDTDKPAIVMPTLSWYDEDVHEPIFGTKREIRMTTGILNNGNYGVFLYFIGSEAGDNSDAARTKRGEVVMVSVDMKISANQEFTIRKVL